MYIVLFGFYCYSDSHVASALGFPVGCSGCRSVPIRRKSTPSKVASQLAANEATKRSNRTKRTQHLNRF